MTEDERLRSGRLVYYAEDIDRINQILDRLLHLSDARCALLVDKEGHLITKRGEMSQGFDGESISALVAGSFAATKEMAKLLGEEEFSVLFHQGVKDSIQLTLVADRALLAVMFDDRTTIGMVRLYANETSTKVAELLKVAAQREPIAGMGADFTTEATKRLSDVFGGGEEEKKGKREGPAPAG